MTALSTRSAASSLRPAAVRTAAERIAGRVERTPLLPLAELPGVLVKAEHLQRSGSFKARGAANALLVHGVRRVVAGSSGNHGLAVATLGAALGTRVTVMMAGGASAAKVAALRRLGAQVVPVDGGVEERDRCARQFAQRTGATLIPSADDELIVAGQGTVGLELFAAAPDLDAVYVPTGGGGLLAGICLAAAAQRRPVRVIGVEPAESRRYAVSLAARRAVELPPSATIADGLRAQRPGEIPFPIIRKRVDDLVGVSDEAITRAMDLLHRNGVPAEPSGAVALAGALESGAAAPRLTAPVAVIVSGGNTPAALADRFPAHPADSTHPTTALSLRKG